MQRETEPKLKGKRIVFIYEDGNIHQCINTPSTARKASLIHSGEDTVQDLTRGPSRVVDITIDADAKELEVYPYSP